MTKDDFIFNLKRCGCLYKDGHTYYEENELIECFEDVGAFNQSSVNPQEPTYINELVQKAYEDGKKDGYVQAKVEQDSKTGHWESFDLTYSREIYKCSICKCTANVPTVLGIPMFKYCPNCGARMAESEDKE